MKIGIVGAGNIGSALARHWTALGHDVMIANSRGPDTIRDVAARTGARAVTVDEAVRGVDVVVLSIPQKAVAALPKSLFASLGPDAIVIDTNNYYPSRDGRIAAIDKGQLESAWVAEQIGRPVIKAFNNILAPASSVERSRRSPPIRRVPATTSAPSPPPSSLASTASRTSTERSRTHGLGSSSQPAECLAEPAALLRLTLLP
jgi:predicted dinucleotide-binding enzyme